MATLEQMTVKEFAKLAGITPQAVTASIRANKLQTGIISYCRPGHEWILTVDRSRIEKKVKK